jgi:hypothetical protein
VQFVALSYCWGTSQQAVTTKSNISSQEQQLLVSDLPQTLQDAIVVTRALDYQYLWVDALCILQDDENDWAVQSSRMADIYSTATLVIAATSASNCNAGFLQARDKPVTLETTLSSWENVRLTARRTKSHSPSCLITTLPNQRLFSRGWMYMLQYRPSINGLLTYFALLQYAGTRTCASHHSFSP